MNRCACGNARPEFMHVCRTCDAAGMVGVAVAVLGAAAVGVLVIWLAAWAFA